MTGLAVSRLINVSVNLSPSAAQFPSVTSSLCIGSSDVIDVLERWREYANIDEVAINFGTTAPEYYDAELFFEQDPKPEQLFIGRWAATATHGLLICGALSTTEQLIATWDAIADGGFKVAIDGGAVTAVTNLVFTGLTNLNAVATEINTRMAAAGLAATCSWNGQQFVFQSTATGAGKGVSALTAAASGDTDISAMLKGTVGTLQSIVPGIAAESALTAFTIIENMLQFYMVRYATPEIVSADYLAIAAYVEADATPHIFSLTTQDPNAVVAAATTDIGYELHQLQYQRTNYQYSSTSLYAVASFQGRAATVDYTASNSAIDLMYKQEPGVVPENLTSSQANSLDTKQYSYYATFNNSIPIIVNGTMAATDFYFDDIQNADWMVAQVQTDLFNVLFQTPTKIPQTDAGVHVLVTTVSQSLAQGINNGVIGPGTWDFNGFGTLAKGQYLESGYYVWAPSVSTQSPANRSARKAPTIQAAVLFSGAVQKVGVLINVQR